MCVAEACPPCYRAWRARRRSSRRLPIAKFTIAFGQIPNATLFGTPPLLVALNLQPFCIGELGERLGCFLDWGELWSRDHRAGLVAGVVRSFGPTGSHW